LALQESSNANNMPGQGEDKSIASDIKKFGVHRTKSVEHGATKSIDMLESRGKHPQYKGSKNAKVPEDKRSKDPNENVSEQPAPKVEPK
jgi:hypothetical protein